MSPDPKQTKPGGAQDAPPQPDFQALLLQLVPSLRRFAISLSSNHADGEDLLQDCLEKAIANQGKWRGTNLRSWTFTIMSNLNRNRHRKWAGKEFLPLDAITDLSSDETQSDPLERDRVVYAINLLPVDYREVLLLVVLEGFRYAEVSAILSIPLGTVMSRLARARRQLSNSLSSGNIIPLQRQK